ncbi:glycosyltransferase family 31 [Fusarium longipes]|uniref:Glycosyltransferase family 31 n=1 Tax=Fusarium longipes TaxID=694270 RepID=A0A395RW80_9HYPO|nr:glycosyltransferase family 31 [Fusarium longipes]
MGLHLSSAWSTPRGWRLITVTLVALTLLLVIPLHRLSDDSPGVYGHLTKYLSHEGAAYDVEEGFVANLNETTNERILNDEELAQEPTREAVTEPAQEIAYDTDSPQYTGQENEASKNPEMPAQAQQPESGKVPNNEDGGLVLEVDRNPANEVPTNKQTHSVAPEETSKPDNVKIEPQGDKVSENKGDSDKPKQVENKFHSGDDKRPAEIKVPDLVQNHNNQENRGGSGATTTKAPKVSSTTSIVSEFVPSQTAELDVPSGPLSNWTGVCEGFPNTDGIMLVMKTGATEAFTKLPAHLLTSLQCLDDYLLFSDLDQQIDKYQIYDVLKDVKDDVRRGRKEFDLYKAQVDCPIPQQYCTADMTGKDGWNLDKYKFLHMVEKAWEMRPNKEWYVFAEADTYVFWPNLVWYLRNKVNGTETPYVGSVAMLKGKPFAHGGSGYIIHGDTMRKMVQIPDLAHKYDVMATRECCGDYLMSLAVMETGKKVKQAHPMFNGEKPVTLPFGNNHWCEPLLTMHHMNPEEVSDAWHFEKTRQKEGPVQIREMYHEFWGPKLKSEQDEWDNLSDDVCYIGFGSEAQAKASDHQKNRQRKESEKNAVEQQAHRSKEHCAKVCESDGLGISENDYYSLKDDNERNKMIKNRYNQKRRDKNWNTSRRCFQWRYHNNVCCVAKSFKRGKPRKEQKPEEKWTSGWFVQGINDWIDAKGDCTPNWKDPR